MKKALIITYYWPPSGGSGVQRWLKFAKYLPQYGWEPIIYTPENPELSSSDNSLFEDIAPELQVIKRKITEPYSYYKLLTGKKEIKANLLSSPKQGGGFSAYIRGNFFIPDPRCWWVRPSVRFLKKWLKENPVDAIISTGPPHSMHLIARELHKATQIPWVADFRDPWTGLFYFKHLRLNKHSLRKHKRLEFSVVNEADRVVVVSPQMKQDFASILQNGRIGSIDDSKIRIITNGFDPDDFSKEKKQELSCLVEDVKKLTEGKFVVVHTGLLPDNANPELFWKALGKSGIGDKLFIATMGQTDGGARKCVEEEGMSDNFHDFGYVSHMTSIAWQKRANLLLLPLRKEKEATAILTGKFFEYIASFNETGISKRIIAVGPVRSDLGDALRETCCGDIFEYADESGMAKAITEAYNDFRTGRYAGMPDADKYSRVNLTALMANLLDEMIS